MDLSLNLEDMQAILAVYEIVSYLYESCYWICYLLKNILEYLKTKGIGLIRIGMLKGLSKERREIICKESLNFGFIYPASMYGEVYCP